MRTRTRKSLVLVLSVASIIVVTFFSSLFSVGAKVHTYPNHDVLIEHAPHERFVSLRISWLHQVMFADGKEGRFTTTYSGPVELVTRTSEGLVRRRAFGVEISGQHRKRPVKIRLK